MKRQMKHAGDRTTKSSEMAATMQVSAPHPEGIKYPPHLLVCKACAEYLKSIDTTSRGKSRAMPAFVKVRGKNQYVRNPRLLQLAKLGMLGKGELESL